MEVDVPAFLEVREDVGLPGFCSDHDLIKASAVVRGVDFGNRASLVTLCGYVPVTQLVMNGFGPERPRDDDILYLVPVVVSSEQLGNDLDIADKSVDVSMTVTDEADRTATAQATVSTTCWGDDRWMKPS